MFIITKNKQDELVVDLTEIHATADISAWRDPKNRKCGKCGKPIEEGEVCTRYYTPKSESIVCHITCLSDAEADHNLIEEKN